MGIAGVLGQLLGGALIQADLFGLGWRAIFLINVPVGLVALPLVTRVVPESRGAAARLDLVGTRAGHARGDRARPAARRGTRARLAAVDLGVARRRAGARRRCSSASGAATRPPLVDLALFRDRSFALGSLTALTFALVPAAFFFVLALYLQQGRGFDALFSGTVFAAVGVGYFAAMVVAAPARRSARAPGARGWARCSWPPDAPCSPSAAHAASSLDLLPGLALVGFGIGLVLVPLSSTVLAAVDPLHAGSAAGVLTTAQQVGGALGVAVIGVVFFGGGAVPHAFTSACGCWPR